MNNFKVVDKTGRTLGLLTDMTLDRAMEHVKTTKEFKSAVKLVEPVNDEVQWNWYVKQTPPQEDKT